MPPASRTFSGLDRRVAAATSMLGELSSIEAVELSEGLSALARRKKLKSGEDLAARARHELSKAKFALPSEPSPARRSSLARCGFDHSQLIVQTLCDSVEGADEELAVRCFREAVKHKKLDDSIMPDRHAVALIKQHLAQGRE